MLQLTTSGEIFRHDIILNFDTSQIWMYTWKFSPAKLVGVHTKVQKA